MTGRRALFALPLLAALARPEAAMATEEPTYRVEKDYGAFEVRAYDRTVVAETEVAGDFGDGSNRGFRRLAGYIFGGNEGGKKIAMTAPVGMEPGGGAWRVTFTMPAAWTLASLPAPEDGDVRLREVPARRVAAVRFSGTWGRARFDAALDDLLRKLRENGLEPSDEPPVYARYDPPWTPWFLRRNEILVPLR